jgi:PAS domain S-box-containing protein
LKPRRAFNILIIDDEAIIRQSMRTYLKDSGYQVVEAENGRAGLLMLEKECPDLVILDLRMPQMGGLQFLETLNQDGIDIPVIVVSGTGTMTSVVQALRLGAWDYLFKPIEDLTMLAHAVEKCLKESQLRQENIAYQERLEELVRERTLELKASEQRYKAVFEYTGTAAIIVEPDHMISMANSRFADLVGMTQQEIEGQKTWQMFIADRDVDLLANHLRNNRTDPARADNAMQYEVALKTASGSPKFVYASLGLILGTECHVVSLVDVTEKKQAEKRWQGLERQLRKSQKMEAIGTLAGGIAHDLNNILSPVLGYADMIMRTSKPDGQVFQRSQKIQTAALRAADLVSQVLAFNRGGTEEKRRIKLHPVVREVVTLLKGSIPVTIKIVDRIDRHCDAVMADPTQIHQVIMNLCTNAYHAMEETGGKLVVQLDQIRMPLEKRVENPNLIQGSGDYLRIQVKDTGCGMADDILERIFDPYFTTKEESKGTGLGLATAYSIVKDCQGDIRVKSTPQQGSCFTVFLPACKCLDREISTGQHIEDQCTGAGERLMVVDDDYDIAAMCKEGFEYLGYRVASFSSSTEALDYFRKNHGQIDLVVTDQTMPEKTGTELIREMLTIRKDLPVILCSGYAAAINQKAVEQIGIKRFIMKPVTVDALSREIQQILYSKER